MEPRGAGVLPGEDAEQFEATDVEGFLRAQREDALAHVVHVARSQLAESCARHFARATEDEWAAARRDLVDSWSTGTAASAPSLSAATPMKAKVPPPGLPQVANDGRAQRYSAVVRELVDTLVRRAHVQPGSQYVVPAVQSFIGAVAAAAQQGQASEELQDDWKALGMMLEEARKLGSIGGMLDGARKFFHQLTEQWVTRMLRENAERAALGGNPTALDRICALIRINTGISGGGGGGAAGTIAWPSNLEVSCSGYPAFALIWWLMRCGKDQDAAEVAGTLERDAAVIRSFLAGGRRMVDERMRSAAAAECERLMKQSVFDPYKLAVFAMVARVQAQEAALCARLRSAQLLSTLQEWIWFRLCLLDSADSPQLRVLQEEIQTMEGKIQSPLLYF
jgi:hypothetical protein